ncbi:hypothetical protein OAO55_02025 [Bacteroidales bacterium]|nr:hypothetical protein [Bacteroidales bacterium]
MDRKKFLKNVCSTGACACIATSLMPINTANASSTTNTNWKDKFIQSRYAKLIELLDDNLDEAVKNKIIIELGRECGRKTYDQKYTHNIELFIEEIAAKWGDKITFDKDKGIIHMESKQRQKCVCPLIDSSKISKSICQCSLGWQMQTYETIMGKKVEARIVESVIYGGNKCAFEIKIIG